MLISTMNYFKSVGTWLPRSVISQDFIVWVLATVSVSQLLENMTN